MGWLGVKIYIYLISFIGFVLATQAQETLPILACPLQSCSTPTVPSQPLHTCEWYSNKSCCSAQDTEEIASDTAQLLDTLKNAECADYFNTLECGYRCSPGGRQFMEVVSQNRSLVSGVNVNLYLCTAFCEEFYSACKDAPYNTNSTMADSFSDAFAFCKAFAPVGSAVYLRDFDCFAGKGVAVSAYRSYAYGPGLEGGVTSNTRGVTNFTVQLVDEFGTPLTQGDYSSFLTVKVFPSYVNPETQVIARQDGTVQVKYQTKRGGNYQVMVLYNGMPIYGSPFKVTWQRPSPCSVTRVESGKPDPPLPGQCSYYSENACCDMSDITKVFHSSNYKDFITTFNTDPECIAQWNILTCGFSCSPAQQYFAIPKDPFIRNTTSEYRICPDFAYRLFNSCADVRLAHDLTVAEQFETAEAFIQANNIDDEFPQIIIDTDCFNGFEVPVRGKNSFVKETQETALSTRRLVEVKAGQVASYSLAAVDIYRNPRLTGGDNWRVDIVGPSNREKVANISGVLQNGTYLGTFNVTRANLDPYEFILQGNDTEGGYEDVRLSPFQVIVRPGDIYGPATIVTGAEQPEPVIISTQMSFRLKTRDRYLNNMISGGQSSFFIFHFLNATDSSIIESVEQTFSIFDYCNGEYGVSYTLPWVAGSFYLEILANDGADDESRTLILRTPITTILIPCDPPDCSSNGWCNNGTCICYPGWEGSDCSIPSLCVPCSVAFGPGLATNPVGVTTYFYIQANDYNHTRIFNGGLYWDITIATPSGAPLQTEFAQNDLGNGLYYVEFTPNYVGAFLLTIGINGIQIFESPFHVTWVGPRCPRDCCGHGLCYYEGGNSYCTSCFAHWIGATCCDPVIVNFTAPTNMAGMFGEGNCSRIISNTAMFGTGHYCVWSAKETLVIWLGSQARVKVGDKINFIASTIFTENGSVPLNLAFTRDSQTSNVIHGANHPVVPIPVIVAPITMSGCSDLVLDGSRSLGSGGRDMKFKWSVLSGPPKTDTIRLFLRNLNTSRVVFPAAYVKQSFEEGEDYIFSLSVENHFGIKSLDPPAYFGVRFDFDPIPMVTLNPSYFSNIVSTRTAIDTKIHGVAVVSGCTSPYLEPRDRLEYSWIKADGDARVQLDLNTANTPQLYIPSGSLEAGKRYTLELRARHVSYPRFIGYSQAIVDVLHTPPLVRLGGGQDRLLPLTRTAGFDLALTGQAVDMDATTENFTYQWSCTELLEQADCFSLSAQQYYFINSPSIIIPSYEFGIGIYEFSLTAKTQHGLPSTTKQRVYTNGAGPMVTAELKGSRGNENTANRNDKIDLVAIALSASGTTSLKWEWSVIDGPLTNSQLEKIILSPSRFNSSLSIAPGYLAPNQTFTFLAKATAPQGVGYATITLKVNERPAAGTCYLRINGTKAVTGKELAYIDLFKIKCANWENEFNFPNSPLRYRFFAIDGVERIVLGTGRYDKDSVDFLLPPGTTPLSVEISSPSGAVTIFNLTATAIVIHPDLLGKPAAQIGFWLRTTQLRPCQRNTDMPCVGQSIWLIYRALNGAVGAKKREEELGLTRREEDTQQRVEELEALEIEQDLSEEELQELGSLKEEMERVDLDKSIRVELRGNMIETLTLDYGVEYNNFALTQRFNLMRGILGVPTEVPSTSVNIASQFFTIWANIAKSYNDAEMNLAAMKLSIAILTTTYASFPVTRRDDSTRSAADQQANSLSVKETFEGVLQLQVKDLVVGAAPFVFSSDFCIASLAKVYSYDLAGQRSLFDDQISFSIPQAIVDSLPSNGNSSPDENPFNTGQNVYTYQAVVYVVNPFNFSTSSRNITTPVFSLRFYSEESVIPARNPVGINVTFFFTDFIYGLTPVPKDRVVSTNSTEARDDTHTDYYTSSSLDLRAVTVPDDYTRLDILPLKAFNPTCKIWDDALVAFTEKGCSVVDFTRISVTCNCERAGDTAAFMWADYRPTTPGPGPRPGTVEAPVAAKPLFVDTVGAVLITLLVACALAVMITAIQLRKWQRNLKGAEMAILATEWRVQEEWGYQRRKGKERPALDDIIPPMSSEFDDTLPSNQEEDYMGEPVNKTTRLWNLLNPEDAHRGRGGKVHTRRQKNIIPQMDLVVPHSKEGSDSEEEEAMTEEEAEKRRYERLKLKARGADSSSRRGVVKTTRTTRNKAL